jgi:sec-independent protein translocase protein TatA
MSLGAGELLVIFLILVLLVGAGQVPKLARSLGKAQREFRRGLESTEDGDR